jgi:hypothetical protein
MGLLKVPFDKIGATNKVNIQIDQYSDLIYGVEIVGSGNTIINMSGYAFSGTVKKHVGASSTASDTINVGFDTSNISVGIVTVLINSGLTTNFDKNSPRYKYEIIATENSSGYKRRIMDGDINVNVGITQNEKQNFSKCIAVIDESDSFTDSQFYEKWQNFRLVWPNRLHYILQPTSTGIAITTDLGVPSNYDSGFGTSIQVKGVNRDNGTTALASDWFSIVGLKTGLDVSVALFIDTSGSMTLATVQASYNKFISTCSSSGILIREESNGSEDWVEPFTGLL